MKEELVKIIENVLKEKGVETPKVVLTPPVHADFGDYSTNVALSYAKELSSKPIELAKEIKERLVSMQIKHIDRIDVIGNSAEKCSRSSITCMCFVL